MDGRRFEEPLITVKPIEGVFDAAQKREIVEKQTEATVSIEGENMRPVTWRILEEVRSGDWGIAGNPLTHRRREEPDRWATGGYVGTGQPAETPAPEEPPRPVTTRPGQSQPKEKR